MYFPITTKGDSKVSADFFIGTVEANNVENALQQVKSKLEEQGYQDVKIKDDSIFFFAHYSSDNPAIFSTFYASGITDKYGCIYITVENPEDTKAF